MSILNCKKPKPCNPPEEETKPCSPPFDVCIGDKTLHWDGSCLTLSHGEPIPDGIYDRVRVRNGCIIGVDYDEPDRVIYTPPYCSPNPTPCQSTTTNTSYRISTNVGNSLVLNASGLFARTFIEGGDNITVAGNGTQSNPYNITFNGSTGDLSIRGEDGITVEERAGVSYVKLTDTGITPSDYHGFTVNAKGQIIRVLDTPDKAPTGGSKDTDDLGVVGLTTSPVVLGGYAVAINSAGRITGLERLATITPGTYSIGAFNIELHEYGGITAITEAADVLERDGTFVTIDNKVVSYNRLGRITNVEDVSRLVDTVAPLPIRDIYRFTVKELQVLTETYGTPVNVLNVTTRSFDVALPAYVTTSQQVDVSGAIYTRLNDNVLTITHADGVNLPTDKTVTLTLRA